MSLTIDADGVHVQTYEEILEERVVAIGTALNLTAQQVQRLRTSVQSTLGQWARITAEQEAMVQEMVSAVYATMTLEAEGAALYRLTRNLGVVPNPALASQVQGTASGTPGTSIPNGTRIQYNPENTVWEVIGGPYLIGGGGTVTIAVEGVVGSPDEVALAPDSGYSDWTVLDGIVGFDDFESTSQPIVGTPIETDAAVRVRYNREAYARAQGPIAAIEAAISLVPGVTFVRVWENRTDVTDAVSGLPPRSINAVVEGGANADIAAAIFRSRPAGAEIFALADGSEVVEVVIDSYGFGHTMAFNRITDVNIWINCVLTTTTSEEFAPPDIEDVVEALLLAGAPGLFGIGDDVLPYKLAGLVYAAGIPGIDNVTVTLSLTGGGGSYSGAKVPISIRERSAFAAGPRIVATQD